VPRPRTCPLDDWHDNLLDIYNANAVRGLAWMLGLAATDAGSARALADLAVAMLRKLPGIGQLSPKVANAAVCALSLMPGENALAQLGRLVTRVTYRGTLTQLDKALETRAAQLGVPREQIEEMAVPGFGLTEVGRRTEQLGGVTAEIVIRGGAVDLIWRDGTGRTVKSVPAAARDTFADEVKELKAAADDIEKMLPAQAARLDRLFLARRTWDFARWSEYYLDHPVVGTLARRLIWVVGGVPAAYADGTLRTRDGLPLEPEWQDHGPLPEADEVRAVCVAAGQVDYDAYWRASGFGELSEIARTRADVLARLLPRLAIGPSARPCCSPATTRSPSPLLPARSGASSAPGRHSSLGRQRRRPELSRAAWRVRWSRSARLGALRAASAYSRAAVARSPSRSCRYAATAA
jgi:uncharacterized protein DUF4132